MLAEIHPILYLFLDIMFGKQLFPRNDIFFFFKCLCPQSCVCWDSATVNTLILKLITFKSQLTCFSKFSKFVTNPDRVDFKLSNFSPNLKFRSLYSLYHGVEVHIILKDSRKCLEKSTTVLRSRLDIILQKLSSH